LAGQAQQDQISADQAAKELANPAGSLASLANNFAYRTFQGSLEDAGNQSAFAYTFQPVLPFPVGDKGKNIIVRPAFTVGFIQPSYNPGEGEFQSLGVNLNDIVFDAVYAGNVMKDENKGYLWGVGLAGTIPIATDTALGGKQWRFGPELFGGVLQKWGLVGVLINNQWNLGGGGGGPGSNDQPFNAMTFTYFYGITLGSGWQILSAPVIAIDWKAESGEDISVPIGTGIAKTLKIGKVTWRFQVEVWKYVVQPDLFGSDWNVILDIRPIVRNPFVRNKPKN
jgi:hypothetical protein